MTTDYSFAYRGWSFICSVERPSDALYQPMFLYRYGFSGMEQQALHMHSPSPIRPLPMHSGTPNNRRCAEFVIRLDKVGVGLTGRQNPCAI
ncbi:hypothetical protein RCH10_004672 [Variovorax sp. GrIS 2.14]